MNIFDLANANSANLTDKLNTLMQQADANEVDMLNAFMKELKNQGTISINLKLSVLIDFFIFEEYQNIYDYSNTVAGLTGKNEDDVLKNKLGSYYTKRNTFDQFFDNAKSFKYGALNAGGLGAIKYGEIGIILKKEVFEQTNNSVFVKDDSLNEYMGNNQIFDIASFEKDIANWDHKHLLALIKHNNDIINTSKEYYELLFKDDGYIEAIFLYDFTLIDLQCVKISKEDNELYYDLAFDGMKGLGEYERCYVILPQFQFVHF